MGWFNYIGLIFLICLLIPNIVYAIFQKGKQVINININKTLLIAEQIGRYGTILFMIFNIPYTYFDFWFFNSYTVYLSVNSALILIYCIVWIVFWNRKLVVKDLLLSIIPSVVFLFSGVMLLNIPLIISALIFGFSHIWISFSNVKTIRTFIYIIKGVIIWEKIVLKY